MKAQIVVIAGPTGSGKNTLIHEVMNRVPNMIRLVTCTTRKPRQGEHDGVDYYFFTPEKFQSELEAGHIPEVRHVGSTGANYGIWLPVLEQALASGKVVLAQVDIIGARYLREKYHASTIFVEAGSFDEYERRIRARSELSDEEVRARLAIAHKEIEEDLPFYEHVIINEDGKLEEAVHAVLEILTKKS